ncbi:hypothetical protein GYB59_22225 [bacterium]|nr:hypothetical protein [bacterium]
MLAGTRDTIGFEWDVNDPTDLQFMQGKFCLWINHKPIGDYESGETLSDVYAVMRDHHPFNNNRENPFLFNLDSETAYDLLMNELYIGDSEKVAIPHEDDWARHDIAISTSTLSDWWLFLVENDNECKIMYGTRTESSRYARYLGCFVTCRGAYDKCVDSFIAYVERRLGH